MNERPAFWPSIRLLFYLAICMTDILRPTRNQPTMIWPTIWKKYLHPDQSYDHIIDYSHEQNYGHTTNHTTNKLSFKIVWPNLQPTILLAVCPFYYSLIYRSKKQIKSTYIIMVLQNKTNQLATSTCIAIKHELNPKTQINPPQKEQNQKPNHVRSTQSQIIQSTKDIAKPKI